VEGDWSEWCGGVAIQKVLIRLMNKILHRFGHPNFFEMMLQNDGGAAYFPPTVAYLALAFKLFS